MTFAAGIGFIVVGAVLAFALTTGSFDGLDLHVVGVILMLAGAVGIALPLMTRGRRGTGPPSRGRRVRPRLGRSRESAMREAVAEDIAEVRTDDQYFRSNGPGGPAGDGE